jgi:Protein kinase domain
MTDQTNPKPGNLAPGEKASVELQKTLLLSEVPEANAMIPQPQAPKPGIEATTTLSSTALSALSQRYEILAEAGHGSMGNVYKARDRETQEIVALKLLKPEIASDQTMIERFKNELLFARKITHKNVCRVHEFNRIGSIAYTSMEFVEGESLRSVLNRFGGLPMRKAIDLVGQICSGLKEAHAQGIVHRDLKPENVMIDAQGNVKIMDFGIARSMEAVTRLTGSMVGTPAYMAPEQVAGKPVDYRTDIYSLGLIMYELFTGAQAFQAENAVAVALKQMRESPVPPHEIEPLVPVQIERAILKCLEKEPGRRFQSIAELERAMTAAGAAGAPVPAQPAVNFALNHHSSHAPALQPAFALQPERKRRSPVGSVFMLALFTVAGYAGWRAWQIDQAIEFTSPPAARPAPAPPDFALDTVRMTKPAAALAPAAAAPAPADQSASAAPSADTKPDADQTANADSQPPAPAQPALAETKPQPNAARQPSPAKSPVGQAFANKLDQRRTGQGYGENEPVSQPPVNDHTPSYLWVGRFEREDKAQGTAKKIEDLGLPVTVVPRQGDTGQFFIVVTGPYGPERVESAMDYLKTQGFANVRLIKNPMGGQRNPNN